MEIEQISKSALVDVKTVKIDVTLPVVERMSRYLEQVKNPYCFMCGKTPVQVSFKADGRELSTLLSSYFMGLKNE
jgi:hypothetical protein